MAPRISFASFVAPLLLAACASSPPAAAAPAFVGTWVAPNGDLLELTPETFHLRFGFEGGTRDNYGAIVERDDAAGHVLLRYTRVLQNGADVAKDDGPHYMSYRIEGDGLWKWIDGKEFKGGDSLTLVRFERR